MASTHVDLSLKTRLEQSPRKNVFDAEFLERRMQLHRETQARRQRELELEIVLEVRDALERAHVSH